MEKDMIDLGNNGHLVISCTYDTQKELTARNGDRVASHPSFSLEDFVSPIHLIHCVLCGCGEYWVVIGEK